MSRPRIHADRVLTPAEKQAAYRERQQQARAEQLAAKNLPPLPAVPTIPGTARWMAQREQARLLLQTMRDEIENYISDRSDAWQESDRAELFQTAIDQADAALSELDSLTFDKL